MAHAHHHLCWVAQGMPGCSEVRNSKAEWPPQKLQQLAVTRSFRYSTRTTVIVSIHNTKVSEVMYRESDSAYSFHSCPKRSWEEAIWSWWIMKYPSKKQCKLPAVPGLVSPRESGRSSYRAQTTGWQSDPRAVNSVAHSLPMRTSHRGAQCLLHRRRGEVARTESGWAHSLRHWRPGGNMDGDWACWITPVERRKRREIDQYK